VKHFKLVKSSNLLKGCYTVDYCEKESTCIGIEICGDGKDTHGCMAFVDICYGNDYDGCYLIDICIMQDCANEGATCGAEGDTYNDKPSEGCSLGNDWYNPCDNLD
jgi:hypothetical protein